MDLSFSDLNFNSVETLPGFEARAAFTVNSASVFKEDVDMVPTIVDGMKICKAVIPPHSLHTSQKRRNCSSVVSSLRCLFDCPPLQS